MIGTSNLLANITTSFKGTTHQKKALEMLQKVGLPYKKTEAYKFTPITSIIEKNLDFNLKESDIFQKDSLYQEQGSHLIFINGVFSEKYSMPTATLKFQIGEVSKEEASDPFSLLNMSFAIEGVTIHANDSLPVFIYHFNSKTFSNPRVIVHIANGHSINIIEKLITPKNVKTFTNSYIQFEVGENSFAYYTKVQNYTSETYTHETTIANVAQKGQFYTNTFSFESALTRNNLTVNLQGEQTEGYMYGLFLLDKNSHVDNNTTVNHIKPNCYSKELYKGILDDKSTGVFNGKIYVLQGAQKTNAFQSNNNILLSQDATLHTKPQLEIWADDVKCSHGCTCGQLDKDAIFYLQARGIDEKTAKAMLLNAFSMETMTHVKVEAVQKEIQQLVAQKLI